MAVIGNTVDVATELACYAQDLERLKEQFATLQAAHDARCEGLGDWAASEATRPLLRSPGTSEQRSAACYQVIHRFGSCVYKASNERTRSCAECTRLCAGYVNPAGDNAYLAPALNAAFDRAGGDTAEVGRMVRDAANYCGRDVLVDGLRPCINFCRGQVDDCPR
jgi:hypothetical protein